MKCYRCKFFRKMKTRQYDGVCCKFWANVRYDDVCHDEKRAEMERRRLKGMR